MYLHCQYQEDKLDFNHVQVIHACIQLSGTRRLGIISNVQSLHALCICIARTTGKRQLHFNHVQVLHACIQLTDTTTGYYQPCSVSAYTIYLHCQDHEEDKLDFSCHEHDDWVLSVMFCSLCMHYVSALPGP